MNQPRTQNFLVEMTPTGILSHVEAMRKNYNRIVAVERKEAIKEIRHLLKENNLTYDDIKAYLPKSVTSRSKTEKTRKPKPAPPAKKRASKKRAHPLTGRKAPIKYRDANGNKWSGRGSTPRWLVEHITIGGSRLDDFLVHSPKPTVH